ncbi:hypothetical protein V6N13_068778 [Hibiscus sabdariffa]|uniref:Uncharacterized protein n=1 Tax=Hibiscus sabdariffa TaxID=183260 RepID=A0ABR2QP50_9ROSI
MKAMEEVVEFLGEFSGDKVTGVGKGTDLLVMISLIPCPVILLLNGSTRFSEQMTGYRVTRASCEDSPKASP